MKLLDKKTLDNVIDKEYPSRKNIVTLKGRMKEIAKMKTKPPLHASTTELIQHYTSKKYHGARYSLRMMNLMDEKPKLYEFLIQIGFKKPY